MYVKRQTMKNNGTDNHTRHKGKKLEEFRFYGIMGKRPVLRSKFFAGGKS